MFIMGTSYRIVLRRLRSAAFRGAGGRAPICEVRIQGQESSEILGGTLGNSCSILCNVYSIILAMYNGFCRQERFTRSGDEGGSTRADAHVG